MLLLHELLDVLTLTDALEHISIVCELHHDTAPHTRDVIGYLADQGKVFTYQRELEGSSKKASLYAATNVFLTLARILTSFKAFSFSLSERFWIFTFLRA